MSNTFQIIFPVFGLAFVVSTFAFMVIRTHRYDAQLAAARKRNEGAQAHVADVSDGLSMGTLLNPANYADMKRQHEEISAMAHEAVKAANKVGKFAGGGVFVDLSGISGDAPSYLGSATLFERASGLTRFILTGRDPRTGQFMSAEDVENAITKRAENHD
ncbi:hypothetical protein TomTYG75_10040 [Sphingobium sp. TomTYG75]